MISTMAMSWLLCGGISALVFLVACIRSHHEIDFVDLYNAVLIILLGYFSVIICGVCLVFLWMDKEY